MDFKDYLKDLWISAAGLMAHIVIEMPLIYFLSGVLGSSPFVFAIPAFLDYIITFCVENNFVNSEKITVKKFFIYVYALPELFMILLCMILFSAAKSGNNSITAMALVMQFTSISTGIAIVLRGLAQLTKIIIGKIGGE